MQPVNRLPQEIISHIAECVRTASNYPFTKQIIPLTHVCQYWREAIISAPTNWTSISYYPIGLIGLSLERSKAAPLRLSLCMWRNSRFRDLITPRIQSIETLRCYALDVVESFTQMFPNFPRSTPNIRSLELNHCHLARGAWNMSIDPFGPFPRTMNALSLEDIPLYPSFLELGTLTKLNLHYGVVRPSLDAILDLLSGNCSLEHVDLMIEFRKFPAPVSQRREVIMNRLQRLSITCWDARIARHLISSIPLRSGVHLKISLHSEQASFGLKDILSGISTTHLLNLAPSTFMEYRSPDYIQLKGPNGSLSYSRGWSGRDFLPGVSFMKFPDLNITNVQEFRFVHSGLPIVFHPLSFPALETFTIERDAYPSHLLFALLSNPSASPLLKTLKFWDCTLTETFMDELSQFASDRKNIASARLDRVVIAHRDGKLPSVDSIQKLGKHVPVVEVGTGMDQPMDLALLGCHPDRATDPFLARMYTPMAHPSTIT